MKKSRFSEHQILEILKPVEAGTPIPELCRKHGMSSAPSAIGAANTAA